MRVTQRLLWMAGVSGVFGGALLVFGPASATGAVAASRAQPGHARYDMELSLRPERARLEVRGTLRLPATDIARDTLRLVLSSWMKNLKLAVVEPRELVGGIVSSDGADGDRTWKLALPKPLATGRSISMSFSYEGDSLRTSQLRVTAGGSLAGGGGEIWYPRLSFDSLTIGTLRFHVPAGETVLSNGTLDEAKSHPAEGEFVYQVENGVKFAFVSAPYRRYRRAGNPRLSLFLLRDRKDAGAMLERVGKVLAVLSTQFGPLPFEEYSVAEAEFGGSTGGTSEFGFFLANTSYVDAGLPLPFIAHELGHAWWGNLIGTKPGPGRMMLTEGIASFGMLRAIEQTEGDSAASRYRQSRYPGYETSGSPREYFDLNAAGIGEPLGTFTPRSQLDILAMHRMANTRGWFLLDMLSREIGRERFARLLRSVVQKHSGGAIGWSEFRAEIETGAGKDVAWFFDDWFQRSGAPTYDLTWLRTSTGIAGSIRQPDTAYRTTVQLEIRGSTGRRVQRLVHVSGSTARFAMDVPFSVADVQLDPAHLVLRWTAEERRRARLTVGLTKAEFERRFGSSSKSVALYRAALDSIAEPDTAGLRFALGYGLGAALLSSGDSASARVTLEAALLAPVRRPQSLPAAYLLLARLAWAKGDTPAARTAARAALTADAAVGGRTGIAESLRAMPWSAEILNRRF